MKYFIIGLILFTSCRFSSTEADLKIEQSVPEQLTRSLYELVSFQKNESPDWDKVRSCFLENGLVAMRYTKDSTAVFTIDQWIQDFENFIERREISKTGFQEKIIQIKSMVFGNIAKYTVIYESKIPGVSEGHRGVDCFHLIYINNSWKIVSLINEIPGIDRPIPSNI